jgi:hypothetical protein
VRRNAGIPGLRGCDVIGSVRQTRQRGSQRSTFPWPTHWPLWRSGWIIKTDGRRRGCSVHHARAGTGPREEEDAKRGRERKRTANTFWLAPHPLKAHWKTGGGRGATNCGVRRCHKASYPPTWCRSRLRGTLGGAQTIPGPYCSTDVPCHPFHGPRYKCSTVCLQAIEINVID